jgi:hypothetical protein
MDPSFLLHRRSAGRATVGTRYGGRITEPDLSPSSAWRTAETEAVLVSFGCRKSRAPRDGEVAGRWPRLRRDGRRNPVRGPSSREIAAREEECPHASRSSSWSFSPDPGGCRHPSVSLRPGCRQPNESAPGLAAPPDRLSCPSDSSSHSTATSRGRHARDLSALDHRGVAAGWRHRQFPA